MRYPLSSTHVLLNLLTSGNLTFVLPISFNFLSKANYPVFICSITDLSYPIVTIYKSFNVSAMLVSLPGSNSPGVVVTAALGGISSMLVYYNRGSECVTTLRGETSGWC